MFSPAWFAAQPKAAEKASLCLHIGGGPPEHFLIDSSALTARCNTSGGKEVNSLQPPAASKIARYYSFISADLS